jgi:hypothetical protein
MEVLNEAVGKAQIGFGWFSKGLDYVGVKYAPPALKLGGWSLSHD